MIAMILLLKRKPGMTREQFRRHYETSHVMLAKKHLGHLFHDYRRHYVGDVIAMRGEEVVVNGVEEGAYDVITKIVFRDQAALDEFWRIYAIPEVFAELRADEQAFLDMPTMRVNICEEVRTWTAADLAKS
mgnify:FL=1